MLYNCIEIKEPEKFDLNCLKIDVSGFNKQNGQANVNISGGTIPYLINWENGLNNDTIYNLTKGVYRVL